MPVVVNEGSLVIISQASQVSTNKGWRLFQNGDIFMVLGCFRERDGELQLELLCKEGFLSCFADDLIFQSDIVM